MKYTYIFLEWWLTTKIRIFASLFPLRIYFSCIPLSFLSSFSIVRADFQNRAAYGVSHVLYIFFSNALAYVADVDRRNLTRINVVTIGLIHMCHGLHWFFWLRWNCKALPVWYAPGYFRLMFLYMLLRVFLVSWNTSCRVRERDCPFSLVLSSIDFLFIWPALPLWFIQAISKKKKRKKFLAWLRDVDKSHLFKKKMSFNRVYWVINELKEKNTSPKKEVRKRSVSLY